MYMYVCMLIVCLYGIGRNFVINLLVVMHTLWNRCFLLCRGKYFKKKSHKHPTNSNFLTLEIFTHRIAFIFTPQNRTYEQKKSNNNKNRQLTHKHFHKCFDCIYYACWANFSPHSLVNYTLVHPVYRNKIVACWSR